jgi:hypothetical protein
VARGHALGRLTQAGDFLSFRRNSAPETQKVGNRPTIRQPLAPSAFQYTGSDA